MLALVVNALALVRLGRALHADLGGNLADLLLGDALHRDVGVVGNLKGDVVGSRIDNGVGVAQGEVKILALERGTVADAGELELLLKALGDADDHVVKKGAGEALLGVGGGGLVNADDVELGALLLDLDEVGEGAGELALAALDGNGAAIDCHSDSGRNLDRLLTNTRHGCLLSFLP